ncbi:MAG: hypothetical protein GX957_06350 [Clostridiaceae bacterium]|nr:hypothetical protein [Clostridiaceae bacterium]
MDKKTAYSILKINAYTSPEIISKRHDAFVILYGSTSNVGVELSKMK